MCLEMIDKALQRIRGAATISIYGLVALDELKTFERMPQATIDASGAGVRT